MFWKLFRKKPAPKPEPEKKEESKKTTPISDVCKGIEGYFTGTGHPANTVGVTQILVGWPYYNGYTVIPDGMYPVIRVDGHCFRTFTKKLAKPFDQNMVKAMCMATKKLIEFFSACYGYTQSDEITIVLPKDSQDYGRKTHKLASLAASIATAEFIRYMEQYQDKKLTKLPAFDGRAFALPDETALAYYQIWRQQDATRNSISAVARAYFSHKLLLNKNSDDKVAMLKEKGVDFWKDYSTAQILGFYFKRKLYTRRFTVAELEKLPEHHEARKNPYLEVVRSEILKLDFYVKVPGSVVDDVDAVAQILPLVTKDSVCGTAESEVPNETSNTGDE
jgi:tRNA(His) 5'-end guanylyltransferase